MKRELSAQELDPACQQKHQRHQGATQNQRQSPKPGRPILGRFVRFHDGALANIGNGRCRLTTRKTGEQSRFAIETATYDECSIRKTFVVGRWGWREAEPHPVPGAAGNKRDDGPYSRLDRPSSATRDTAGSTRRCIARNFVTSLSRLRQQKIESTAKPKGYPTREPSWHYMAAFELNRSVDITDLGRRSPRRRRFDARYRAIGPRRIVQS